MDHLDKLKNEWFDKEKYKIEVKKKHRYLHVDHRLITLNRDFVKEVWIPSSVAGYSFFPFALIHEDKLKFEKNEKGKKRVIVKKQRPISYARHYDSLIYSWYAFILSDSYEKILEDENISKNVIAYRSFEDRMGNDDFMKEATDFIKLNPSFVAINMDVSDFFGSLVHKKIKDYWKKILNFDKGLPDDHYAVFTAVTRFSQFDLYKILKIIGVSEKKQKRLAQLCTPTEFRQILSKNKDILKDNTKSLKGIPQGAAISCVLSNIYMIDFDKILAKAVGEMGGFYRRYSDDVLVICPPEKVTEIDFLIKKEMDNLGLTLNINKTEIHYFVKTGEKLVSYDVNTNKKDGFKYLGIQFNGKEVLLRHAGYAKFQSRLSRGVRKAAKWASKKNKGVMPTKYIRQFTRNSKKSNYLTYADRVSKTFEDSKTIKKQTSDKRIANSIRKKIQRYGK